MKTKFFSLAVTICSMGTAMAGIRNDNLIFLGEVTAQSGKSVSGARVKITNVCLNQVFEVAVAPNGTFQFEGSECGNYIVEANAEGFASAGQIVEPKGDKIVLVQLQLKEKQPAQKSSEKPSQVSAPAGKKG
ncbi:MAG: carboxypeptidase regulatory-like domain-containing protein [Bacteroidetes bacterium]|nr:carboxypeptidase regulatory-like domain-containing protein [Bacteroidota bacterium]